MSTPTTRTHPTTDKPAQVAAKLADLAHQYQQAVELPEDTHAARAVRASAIALVCARRAGWWRVLECWTYRDSDLHRIYGAAVIAARHEEQRRARFWRDLAADWQARAQGRPDSGLWAMWDHIQPEAVA